MNNESVPTTPMSRMAALSHFFNLQTHEEKKEYLKLTEADRQELTALLKAKGYNITDEPKK